MMRPTRWQLLLAAAVLAGAVMYLVTRSQYDNLPTPRVVASLWLALLAIAECYMGVMTRARLAGRAGTRPINPLVVARFVALAKASSIVGAIATGAYAGFLIWVARINSDDASRDTRTSAFGVGFAVLLTLAGVFLERICRVPNLDDDDYWPPETAD